MNLDIQPIRHCLKKIESNAELRTPNLSVERHLNATTCWSPPWADL